MKKIIQSFFSLIVLSLFLCGHIQNVSAAPVKKTVLLLFPGQPNSAETLLAAQKIRSVFDGVNDVTVDLYSEYMDLNRFPGETNEKFLLESYQRKYSGKNVDLVLTAGESALNFWLKNRVQVLPNTPVVVFDILSSQLAGRKLPADITGVHGVVDYTTAVNWVLLTRPSIKEIVLIYGTGQTDQETLLPVIELKTKLDGKIRLTDWGSKPWTDIKTQAAALPATSMIVYHRMNEDALGVKVQPEDVLRELARVSSVPVLSGYEHYIGSGTVGGYMYSIEQQAGLAGRMALRILRGDPVSAIPMTPGPINQFVFDEQALKRWNISQSTLPAGSILMNREYSIWDNYKLQITIVGSIFLALLFLTGFLFWLTGKLKNTQQKLSQLNVTLETQVRERTAALSQTNNQLSVEVVERKKAEDTLRIYTRQLEEMQVKLQEQTIRDPLTGAFNRRYLIETLEREIANSQRNEYPLCLMMMDIDHFKNVNDTFGHQTGDEVLKKLVRLLEQTTRKGDVVCRYGGEEFVVLLPRITLKDAVERAEIWRKTLQDSKFQLGDKTITVTISIGICSNRKAGATGDQLLSYADQALLVAKKTGRNRVIAVQ